MATLIKFNGEQTEVKPVKGKVFALKQMQKLVGGFIDFITIPDGRTMVLNDEGRLHNLPMNVKASELAGFVIVGDVLLCEKNEVE